MDESNSRTYTEANIVVLSGPEAVRKRPGMYIGSTDARGLHHLLFDLVDLAVEEVSKGPGRAVAVELHKDGSATVRDDGPGFAIEGGADMPALDAAMTRLHGRSWNHSGMGLAVLNALSSTVNVQVRRGGFLYQQRFGRGETVGPLERLGPSPKSGTAFTFRPDPEIFAATTFDPGPIAERLAELAALNPEIRFEFVDGRSGRSEVWERRGGLVDLVRDLNRGREPIHEPVAFKGRCGKAELSFAFQYHAGSETDLRAFANQVRLDASLTHIGAVRRDDRSTNLVGFLRGLRQAVQPFPRWSIEPAPRVRLLEGLTAAVSIRLEDAMYSGACRNRLANPEAESIAFSIAFLRLFAHFEEDPELARRIRDRVEAES